MMGQDKSGKFSFNTCFCPTGREMTFENFFKSTFLKQPRVCQKQKKIRLNKYFGILSWKGAPVGKIKSFMVTSGLRFSKFQNFYFISEKKCVTFLSHCKCCSMDIKTFFFFGAAIHATQLHRCCSLALKTFFFFFGGATRATQY